MLRSGAWGHNARYRAAVAHRGARQRTGGTGLTLASQI